MNNTGFWPTSRFDPLNLPRIAMDREHAGSLYKLVLLLGEPPSRCAAA